MSCLGFMLVGQFGLVLGGSRIVHAAQARYEGRGRARIVGGNVASARERAIRRARAAAFETALSTRWGDGARLDSKRRRSLIDHSNRYIRAYRILNEIQSDDIFEIHVSITCNWPRIRSVIGEVPRVELPRDQSLSSSDTPTFYWLDLSIAPSENDCAGSRLGGKFQKALRLMNRSLDNTRLYQLPGSWPDALAFAAQHGGRSVLKVKLVAYVGAALRGLDLCTVRIVDCLEDWSSQSRVRIRDFGENTTWVSGVDLQQAALRGARAIVSTENFRNRRASHQRHIGLVRGSQMAGGRRAPSAQSDEIRLCLGEIMHVRDIVLLCDRILSLSAAVSKCVPREITPNHISVGLRTRLDMLGLERLFRADKELGLENIRTDNSCIWATLARSAESSTISGNSE